MPRMLGVLAAGLVMILRTNSTLVVNGLSRGTGSELITRY